jgi:arginase
VEDRGNITPCPLRELRHPNSAIKALPETVAWIEAIAEAAYRASGEGMLIFIGGDHSLSAGSMTGLARRAAEEGRELFVLWLDSHPDFHTPETTTSGNLHGVPMAYATGREGFDGYFPSTRGFDQATERVHDGHPQRRSRRARCGEGRGRDDPRYASHR